MAAETSTMSATTEAEEFVERLLSEETHAQPSDEGTAADLPMQLPPWYDEKKFKARYSSTMLHIVAWVKYELKPGSESWKSLLEVRTRHLKIGKNVRTIGLGTVSQRDVALTQFGFAGFALLSPDKFGIQAYERDSWEGFVHLWRTIMYMLGLKDEYNVCSGTVEQTRDICQVLLRRVFAPLLEFPPEPLEHMAYVIFDGMWSVLPLSSPRSGMYLTRHAAGVPGYCHSCLHLTAEAEEFVERLLSEETHAQPSDDCKASELSMQLPPWYDDRKFKAGQRFFWDNLFGQVGMLVVGLITIISVPTILHVLAHSRRSSSSHTAYRRYSSTFLHIVSWTKYDLKPGSPSWRSLQEVRTRHVRAGKNARTVGVGTISQRDIALTQFGLMGFVVLCPDKLGIQAFKSDSWEGFVHMWRTLIYMLGLKDEYNLCSGTVEQTTDICQVLLRQVFEPLLEFPPEPLEHMAYVIFDGMWSVLPLVEPRSGMYFTRYVAGVPGYVYTEQELIDFRRKLAKGQIETAVEPVKKGWHEPTPRTFNIQDYELLSDVPEYRKFNFTERGYFHKLRFLAKIYTTGMGRFLLNAFVRLSLFLAEYFPVFAFHRFGFNNSFVNKFDESIADRTKPLSNKEVKELLDRPPWYLKWNPFYSADKRH